MFMLCNFGYHLITKIILESIQIEKKEKFEV